MRWKHNVEQTVGHMSLRKVFVKVERPASRLLRLLPAVTRQNVAAYAELCVCFSQAGMCKRIIAIFFDRLLVKTDRLVQAVASAPVRACTALHVVLKSFEVFSRPFR